MALFDTSRTLGASSPAIPQFAGQPALVPVKLSGREGLGELFEYRLTLATPDGLNPLAADAANFALDAFVGQPITVSIELEGSGTFLPGSVGSTGAANRIEITAKDEVLINGGGSYTRWNAGGIESGTLGDWTVHSDSKTFIGPKSLAQQPPTFATPQWSPPDAPMSLFLHYPDLTGVPGASYRVVFDTGELREGQLDETGLALLHNVPSASAQVYYGETSKTRPPQLPAGFAPTFDQIRCDVQSLGHDIADEHDLERLLAQLTERDRD